MGLGLVPASVCAECHKMMILLLYEILCIIYFIQYIVLPLDGAEHGTQVLKHTRQVPHPWATPLGCDYYWKSALASLMFQNWAEAEISTALPHL